MPTSFPKTTSKPIAPGTVIGRFKVLRQVGSGGTSNVFEVCDVNAHESDDHERFAIKVMHRDASVDMRRRFRAEGEILTRLRNPHIAPVIEYGVDEDQDYIVMPLINGVSIAEWSIEQPRQRWLDKLANIADALAEIHQAGIIHRDIKPDNILIDQDDMPYLVDFGLVYRTDHKGITLPEKVLGTPVFMSPEQTTGDKEALGPGSDIWAMGVIIYYLSSGKLPFDGDSIMATFHAINTESALAPSYHNEFIPQEIDTIVERCLAKQPIDRYQNANDLAHDLRNAARGQRLETFKKRTIHSSLELLKAQSEQKVFFYSAWRSSLPGFCFGIIPS